MGIDHGSCTSIHLAYNIDHGMYYIYEIQNVDQGTYLLGRRYHHDIYLPDRWRPQWIFTATCEDHGTYSPRQVETMVHIYRMGRDRGAYVVWQVETAVHIDYMHHNPCHRILTMVHIYHGGY